MLRREEPSHALYLHIPFCATKCTYCAFNTYTQMEAIIPSFVKALCLELRILSQARPGLPIHTVYFGGGTPSLLTASQLHAILDQIASGYKVQPDAEITLEANPNDLDEGYARELRALGIQRISLGMQSAQEKELRLFARRHGNAHLLRAVSAIRQAGIDNFNLDLIFGIPHQSLPDWQESLQQAIHLQPTHLSLYALSLEPGTPMREWVMSGQLPLPDEANTVAMYEWATDRLNAEGYQQYEISNWCRPGYESRHNLQYWRNLPYLACGPGAHGWANGVRYQNLLSPREYIDRLRQTVSIDFPLTPVVAEHETVDRKTQLAETLMMGLRLTQEGIPLHQLQQRFDVDLLQEKKAVIQRFCETGFLEITAGALRLTREGRFVSNAILRDLI
ncbi:MAG: radical SAM family heme chaperone HemW [Chloroflexi bacterium]|nr:radical SAM family heme chaperone HemW [Chloroflexota bacterium]